MRGLQSPAATRPGAPPPEPRGGPLPAGWGCACTWGVTQAWLSQPRVGHSEAASPRRARGPEATPLATWVPGTPAPPVRPRRTRTRTPNPMLASPGSPFSPFNPLIPGRPWGGACRVLTLVPTRGTCPPTHLVPPQPSGPRELGPEALPHPRVLTPLGRGPGGGGSSVPETLHRQGTPGHGAEDPSTRWGLGCGRPQSLPAVRGSRSPPCVRAVRTGPAERGACWRGAETARGGPANPGEQGPPAVAPTPVPALKVQLGHVPSHPAARHGGRTPSGHSTRAYSPGVPGGRARPEHKPEAQSGGRRSPRQPEGPAALWMLSGRPPKRWPREGRSSRGRTWLGSRRP